MKKILSIIFLVAIVTTIYAQERTVDINAGIFDVSLKKWCAYNGNTSDRLIPTTRDTIDYYVVLKNVPNAPQHFYFNVTLDTIAGVDTTVSISVLYKKFASEDYSTLISAANTSVISAETQVSKTSLGVTSEYTETSTAASHVLTGTAFTIKQDTAGFKYYPADSLKVPATTLTEASYVTTTTKVVNSALYYGYLKLRLILNGNDSVGTGIKVKRVELQFY